MAVQSSTIERVSPAQLRQRLKDHHNTPIKNYIPVCVLSHPGLGKTTIVESVADELGVEKKIVRPIQHESVEFTGVPALDGKNAYWAPFGELLPTSKNWKGFVALDEITQLDATQQRIVASLIDKAGVAGSRIPVGARLVLMGNRIQDRAGSNKLLSLIENRCAQYELVFSRQDWQIWATQQGVSQLLISFADFKGDSFVSFDPTSSVNCTPRIWEKVDIALKYMGESAESTARALIGQGMAAELFAFREHYDILHGAMERIMNGEAVGQDFKEVSVRHALIGAIVAYIRDNQEKLPQDKLDNIVNFAVNKLDKVMCSLLCLRMVSVAPMRSINNQALRKWMSDNKSALAQWNTTGKRSA